jgi:hypothetical protein
MKLTVPVVTTEASLVFVTVAVNVTAWPKNEGSGAELRIVVVGAGTTV